MNQWSEADRYMLEQIRSGSGEAWSQFVEKYQGRLIAFARRRAPRSSDPEDLVQDVFLRFLRGLGGFREQATFETYLFVILRRRLAEIHRGRRISACSLSELDVDGMGTLPAADPTASWYIRQDEHRDAARTALENALQSLIGSMQERLDLRNVQIVELLFYAQWPNPRIAENVGLEAVQIAQLKHRWLKELRGAVAPTMSTLGEEDAIPWNSPDALDSLLTEIWENRRPSCPKRSTVGGYVLDTLDDPWRSYIDFHINQLGCSFCRANLEDLQEQTRHDAVALRHRILQSTVGFFKER